MKKMKLLTSLSACLLLFGLGACDENTDDKTADEGSETTETEDTSESSETGDTGTGEGGDVSTEGAYALVGDFVDASWDAEPASNSKYFIPAGTTHYEVEVEIDPDLTWTAGLRVVEWGKDNWTLVAGYDQLDANSTGVIGEGSDNNIQVETGATYDIVLDFGETNSILVTLQEGEGNEGDGEEVEKIPGTEYVIGESYWLGFNMSNVDYYFDGKVYNSYYGDVTEDTSKAVWVTIDKYEDGYSLSFVDEDENTQYIYMAESGQNRNFKWRENEPYAWSYDAAYDTFVAYDSENTLYFIGTYGTFKDLCCNAYGYLTGEKDTNNTQYPAHLYEIKAPTALYISGADSLSVGLTTQLTVTANAGEYAGATWSSSNEAYATVDETGLVTALDEGEVTIYATSTLDPTIVGSHQMSIVAKSNEPRTLNYSYTFANGNGITTSGGTVNLGGLNWTTTSATYISGEYDNLSRGLQIGSSNNPQTTPWTISTDFGEDVTLTSVKINVVGANSSTGANFTITHGTTKVADAVSFSTTAQDYEYSGLEVSGSTLSISMVCTAKAMYLKYINFSILVDAESTLNW